MNVSELCRRDIVSMNGNASVRNAAEAMRREHVGTVVVTDPDEPGRVMGILSDRDLVIDVLATGRQVEGQRIGELSRKELAGVRESASLREAVEAMQAAAVRRLFVMRADGSVLGLLSLDDVLRAFALELGAVAGALKSGTDRERQHTLDRPPARDTPGAALHLPAGAPRP